MSVLRGKISTFGGPEDSGMTEQEGLSIFEHHEADQRLDLFYHRSYNASVGTSKRLKPDALYFAYRFPLDPRPDRKTLQNTQFLFRNPRTGICAVGWLSDYGPHTDTGRTFDLSPGLANALGVKTDDEVEGVNVLDLGIFS